MMNNITWSDVAQRFKSWSKAKLIVIILLSLVLGMVLFSPIIFVLIFCFDILIFAFTGNKANISNTQDGVSKAKGIKFQDGKKPSLHETLTVVKSGQPIAGKEYAFIDIETTGLYPEQGDKIVEIAILITDASYNEISRHETLINPNRHMSATNIHLITNDMVKDAPTIEDINDEIISVLNGRILVAHNAEFEQKFLNNELNGKQFAESNFLDTLEYSYNIRNIENHKLGTIAKHYKIPYVNAHTAMGDVLILANVLARMIPARPFIISNSLKPYRSKNVLSKSDFSKWVSRDKSLSPTKVYEHGVPKSIFSVEKITELNEIEYVERNSDGSYPYWGRTLSQEGEIGVKLITREHHRDALFRIVGNEEFWEGKPEIIFQTDDKGREYADILYQGELIGNVSYSQLANKPWIKELELNGSYRISIRNGMYISTRLFFKP